MLKEKIENVKALISKKTEGNNKKNIENLVLFLVLLIITMIAINVIWKDDSSTSKKENNNSSQITLANNKENSSTNLVSNEYNLEEKLEDILSDIYGVGKVKVLITYSETSQVIAMYNESYKESVTEENDTSGGKRTIQETDNTKDIIYKEENGEKVPITQKVIMPKIEGAVVIAQGANNASIKTNIVQAVEVLTGIPTHKIQVFEMGE